MTIELGIFAKTFPRSSYKETLVAVADHGFSRVHWNMSCAGLPSMPEEIDPDLPHQIRTVAESLGIAIAALSGTFNMIHPNPNHRRDGMDRLRVLAASCAPLGTSIITVCTGTRDPDDMWRRHPDNDSESAWADLVESITVAVEIAEEFGISIGIEPEHGNVISTAARARKLLDEIDSPRLGIVLDPANLIEGAQAEEVNQLIDQAFALLGDRIISAHAKDRDTAGRVQPAGKGVVPWSRFVQKLRLGHYRGPLIMHGLDEADVPEAARLLTNVLATN